MENEKKEDLRVVRTKRNIKKAFIELAKNETYQKICVKDLCDIAMINRNTFYLHYQNKDDLVREMVDETINILFLYINKKLSDKRHKIYLIFTNSFIYHFSY